MPLGGEWTTRGRTLTAADVHAYMTLAGDFHPLYADAHYATSDARDGIVVPAALVVSVALGLGAMDVPLPDTTALVGMTWRFVARVRLGDTIRAEWRLGRKRPVDEPDVGLAVWQVEVRNQEDTLVAEGDVARLISRRHPLEQESVPATVAEPAAVEESVEAPSLERPSRRRRRRGSGGGASPEAPAAAAAEPEAEASPEEPAAARKRSRRRPGNVLRGAAGVAGAEAEVEVPRLRPPR